MSLPNLPVRLPGNVSAQGIGGPKSDRLTFTVSDRPFIVPADEYSRLLDYLVGVCTVVGTDTSPAPGSVRADLASLMAMRYPSQAFSASGSVDPLTVVAIVDTTGGAVTLGLPAIGAGRFIYIVKEAGAAPLFAQGTAGTTVGSGGVGLPHLLPGSNQTTRQVWVLYGAGTAWHVIDAVSQAQAATIAQQGQRSGTFVWTPGIPTDTAAEFSSWAALEAAVNAMPRVLRKVRLNPQYNGGAPFVIPAGTWNLNGWDIQGAGDTVELAQNCFFTNLEGGADFYFAWRDLVVVGDPAQVTAAIILPPPETYPVHMEFEDCDITMQDLLYVRESLAGSNFTYVILKNTRITSVSAAGTFALVLTGGTNTIVVSGNGRDDGVPLVRGTGTAFYNVDAEGALTLPTAPDFVGAVTLTHNAVAANIGYDDSVLPALGATTAQEALDAIKPLLGGGSNVIFEWNGTDTTQFPLKTSAGYVVSGSSSLSVVAGQEGRNHLRLTAPGFSGFDGYLTDPLSLPSRYRVQVDFSGVVAGAGSTPSYMLILAAANANQFITIEITTGNTVLRGRAFYSGTWPGNRQGNSLTTPAIATTSAPTAVDRLVIDVDWTSLVLGPGGVPQGFVRPIRLGANPGAYYLPEYRPVSTSFFPSNIVASDFENNTFSRVGFGIYNAGTAGNQSIDVRSLRVLPLP